MEKKSICLNISQIKSHLNFGNNLPEAKAKKVRFYFVTLKWHRSTCYVNWAILIGDLVDVTTMLLPESERLTGLELPHPLPLPMSTNAKRLPFFLYVFTSTTNISAIFWYSSRQTSCILKEQIHYLP